MSFVDFSTSIEDSDSSVGYVAWDGSDVSANDSILSHLVAAESCPESKVTLLNLQPYICNSLRQLLVYLWCMISINYIDKCVRSDRVGALRRRLVRQSLGQPVASLRHQRTGRGRWSVAVASGCL